MVRFGIFVKSVLMMEGVHSDIKDDAGGKTYFGISSKSNPEILKTNDKLKAALSIYRKKYYNGKGVNQVKNDKLAFILFDHFVNPTKEWGREIQRAVNLLATGKIKEDGIIGARTMKAVYSLNDFEQDRVAHKVISRLNAMKLSYYSRAKNRSYVNGVINRFSMRALLASQGGSDTVIEQAESLDELARAHSIVLSHATGKEYYA